MHRFYFALSAGVVFESTAPLGPGLSTDPADHLQPGEAVGPFAFAITAVPEASAATVANKVIGAKFDSGVGLIQLGAIALMAMRRGSGGLCPGQISQLMRLSLELAPGCAGRSHDDWRARSQRS